MSSSIANVDHMVEEFLLYRGFTQTFRCLENEKSKDRAKSFQENKIVEQVFQYLVNFEMESFISLWDFLCKRFFLHLDQEHLDMIAGLKMDLLKFYLTNAVKSNNKEKCHEFFATYSHEILSETSSSFSASGGSASSSSSSSSSSSVGSIDQPSQQQQAQQHQQPKSKAQAQATSLRQWYVLPYLENPEKDAQFSVFFTAKWVSTLRITLNNFLSVVLSNAPPPKLILLDRWYKSDVQHAMRRQLKTVTEEVESLRIRCRGYEKRLTVLQKLLVDVSAHFIISKSHEHSQGNNRGSSPTSPIAPASSSISASDDRKFSSRKLPVPEGGEVTESTAVSVRRSRTPPPGASGASGASGVGGAVPAGFEEKVAAISRLVAFVTDSQRVEVERSRTQLTRPASSATADAFRTAKQVANAAAQADVRRIGKNAAVATQSQSQLSISGGALSSSPALSIDETEAQLIALLQDMMHES